MAGKGGMPSDLDQVDAARFDSLSAVRADIAKVYISYPT
jgi:hypothetical protein